MRKNGSRLISISQYRLTDLFLFAVILVVYDLLSHFALRAFAGNVTFIFTLTVPIVMLVMIRWGWPAVFFAVGDGILFSILKAPTSWQTYLSYTTANLFLLIGLIPLKLIGKEKIVGRWYFSAAFVIFEWVLMNIGLMVMQIICGVTPAVAASSSFGIGYTGMMSLAAALVLILVLRRLDGMVEDQKHYLLRLDAERREKMRIDEFGEDPIEIDEETLSILNKRDEDLE